MSCLFVLLFAGCFVVCLGVFVYLTGGGYGRSSHEKPMYLQV